MTRTRVARVGAALSRRVDRSWRADELVRPHRFLNPLFFLVLAVMIFHEAEHVAQVAQKDALDATCPHDCRGLLGFVFDVEWVHAAYNHSILFMLAGLFVGYRMWRPAWRRARPGSWALLAVGIFVIQGYHVVEHTVKLEQWFANGRRSPTPGLLGKPLAMADGRNFSLIELHFLINTIVLACVLGGYLGFRFHRHIWSGRPRLALALAGGTLASFVLVVAVGSAFRPPTVRLAAGVHEGPLVLDRAQTLVGEPGAVVRGGIRVLADRVTVRGVKVVGGDYGIDVDGADEVVLQDVAISGAALDGIHVRRSSVIIRDCSIESRGRYAQGIDISFAFDLVGSLVQRCAVTGGMEGIVSHFARVRVRDNRVSGTSLRGITVTEMSMGAVELNDVERSLGVGIFCGDYSRCEVEGNVISDTRPDMASGDAARRGYAVLSHFGASARLEDNTVIRSPGGVAALVDAELLPPR